MSNCEFISGSNLLDVSTTWLGTSKTLKYPSNMFCFQYQKGFWLVAPLPPMFQVTSIIYSISINFIQCEIIPLGFSYPPMAALEDRQSFRRLWKERPLELTLCPGSKEDDAAVGELIL